MTKRNLNNVRTLSDEELLNVDGGYTGMAAHNVNTHINNISDAGTYKTEVDNKRHKRAGGGGTDLQLTAFP